MEHRGKEKNVISLHELSRRRDSTGGLETAAGTDTHNVFCLVSIGVFNFSLPTL